MSAGRLAADRADYSGTTDRLRPHDLVWVSAAALSPGAPPWALDRVRGGAPVVIRRAPRGRVMIPVGVRGVSRGQRYADSVTVKHIDSVVRPESLTDRRADRVPALRCVTAAAELLTATGYRWGVTGAVGFELATRWPVCHAASDLDLIVRMPQPLSRDRARALHRALTTLAVRCDVQLETPCGGLALADWAGTAARCLIKSDAGPFLTANPWANPAAKPGTDAPDAHGALCAPWRALAD